jgi:alkylation response protein AidB-like acyl-CoA dehydrogenase
MMDFERGTDAAEAERRVQELLRASGAAAAPGALDAGAARRLVLAAQRFPGEREPSVEARLGVARASPSLLVALEATRQLRGVLEMLRSDGAPSSPLTPLPPQRGGRGTEGEGGSSPAEERDALARGERIGAVALGDAGGGPLARLERTPGGWRLTACKTFVLNAPVADWIAVFAEADGREAVAIVAPGDPGVSVGAPLPLLGLDALAVGAVEAEGAAVPEGRVLGPLEDRAASARCARAADLALAIAAAGLMRGVLRAANHHAHVRLRGGRPLFADQEVAFPLAEVLALTDAAELLCHRAAWAASAGEPAADRVVRCAKVFCVESAERAASVAIQVMGEEGYRRGSPAERAYRDAKGLALAGTPVEVARMAIADDLLARARP